MRLRAHVGDVHLAIAADGPEGISLEGAPHVGDSEDGPVEEDAPEAVRPRVGPDLHDAVLEFEVEILSRFVEGHLPAGGVDGLALLPVAFVVDPDVPELATFLVDDAGMHVEPGIRDAVDRLLAQVEGRFLAPDAGEEHLKVMVRLRQDRVVEPRHPARQEDRGDEDRRHYACERDAARLDRRDLEVALQPAEHVQDGDEHGHGQRLGDDERDRIDEDFGDHRPVKALADESFEPLAHLIEQEQHRETAGGEQKRRDVKAQDVPRENSHRPEITVFRGRCQPAGTRSCTGNGPRRSIRLRSRRISA